jgi:WD40 repeat protein/DNA replication protein DnaC
MSDYKDFEDYADRLIKKYSEDIPLDISDLKKSRKKKKQAAEKHRNPFKFLDPYTIEDKDIFFGRELEVSELYYRVFSSTVTVVFGESGVGKTSLLQCGLFSRLEKERVEYITIRSAVNPLESLKSKLLKRLEKPHDLIDPIDILKEVSYRLRRTIILVFDQFEEIFILQNPEVRIELAKTFKKILNSGLDVKIIFTIREEYFARLVEFEIVVPYILENKVWVKKMSAQTAEEAVKNACQVCHVEIEEKVLKIIFSELAKEGKEVELPLMQVVMDYLYSRAVEIDKEHPRITFKGYVEIGGFQNIFSNFIEKQVAQFDEPGKVMEVLKSMVTLEGTKRVVSFKDLQNLSKTYGEHIEEKNLREIIHKLINRRILREDPKNHQLELKHDILAQVIDSWIIGPEKELEEVRKIVDIMFAQYQKNGKFPDEGALKNIEMYLPKLNLKREKSKFIEKCINEMKRPGKTGYHLKLDKVRQEVDKMFVLYQKDGAPPDEEDLKNIERYLPELNLKGEKRKFFEKSINDRRRVGKIYYQLKQKPVIFLAFANDRVNDTLYLRNLSEEQRGIRNALNIAVKAELCEVVTRSNASIEDILDVFQDENYNDRIAIFHYSGHANYYRLLVETFEGRPSPAYREGLISFLSKQKGLKFIFLNACSTQQHALELIQAGIPAVIGTSQDIDDQVATKLAIRFYNGIANGFTLERAWREAEYYIKIRMGSSNLNDMYHWSQHEKHQDRFPWDIFFKEGAEKVKEWNLPDVVNDPLFGLPSLPQTYKLPEKPFLFLERYQRKHAEIFFGRSYYIRQLYNRIIDGKSSPIILFYGQSGVGKSSLLEAGLLPRLEDSHTVLYVRRNQEKGLLGTLERALNNQLLSVKTDIKNPTVAEKWKLIEFKTHKPLVIILDQVEEMFTRSNKRFPNEFEEFMRALKNVFEKPSFYPKGKLILSYRKEYHPEIDNQFKRNELDRTMLFLQSLNQQDIIEVVTGLTRTKRLQDKYCLNVEDQLPIIIADDLLEDRDSPIAPTLQILLTKMWDNSKEEDEFSIFRHFTIEQYQDLRKQGLLMEDFFKQQMEKLGNWERDVIDSGLALDLLKFHTTPLGTACSRDINDIRETYQHRRSIIDKLVQRLKNLYLLTDIQHGKHETSLAHDTLAPIVIKEYINSDTPGQRAARILASKIEEFKKDKNKIWLDEADLEIVELGKKGMRVFNSMEEKLLDESRKRMGQRVRQIKRYKTIQSVSLISIVIFAMIAVLQWKASSNKAKITKANLLTSQAQLILKYDLNTAIRLAEESLQLNNNNIVKRLLIEAAAETLQRPFYNANIRQNNHVNSAVFSPDDQRILTASSDKTAKLWDLQGNCLCTFQHDAEVYYACFSRDGTKILTASSDYTARLWNLYGNLLAHFKHHHMVTSAVFSPEGSKILTASADKTAKLWDLNGGLIADFKGHTDMVTSVVFSKDSSKILTASGDYTAKLWDLNGSLIADFRGHTEMVNSAIFSPDGSKILTDSADKTAKLWDLNGDLIADFKGHEAMVTSAVFSTDGSKILTASADTTAKLWDLNGDLIADFKGHIDMVTSAVFFPDGSKILTASGDYTAKLWDLNGSLIADFRGHTDMVTSAVFSTDGSKILTASRDKTAKLWDLKKQPITDFKHRADVTSAVFSPQGTRIITISNDNTIKLWDLHGNIISTLYGHTNFINSALFSPDGTQIITASADNTSKLWDISGNILKHFIHTSDVNSAFFSPGGHLVLTASYDNTAKLWDLQGNLLRTYKHQKGVISARFSPDGKKILTASFDETAKLWDLHGNLLTSFKKQYGQVNIAIFSPDSTMVLTVSIMPRLWDINGRHLTEFDILKYIKGKMSIEKNYFVNNAVFSPDSNRVLTVHNDNTARLWDLQGHRLTCFRHRGFVYSATFSPDGTRVLTASADGTAKMWDLSGNLLADYNIHKGILYSAVFSPDGNRVLTASADNTAKLQYTPEGLIQWLKTAPLPRLSQEEMKKYEIQY